ncbi:maleylpyruvate isomerase N-terminal domain-containing protein [Cyclobacterium plantarum]|uniref:Maleylpyruvate isomerase family protein n=1 Tax=Cyclobacterium plantarum TaxID=2716263 RepID=A0ABX0H2E2_9BACT|nr:maleylpyruvate isomerase N-terminal domain-containing protein [Cyclobacterium plantarum]NHE55965.1 maleylpyruvate isomerase family protein [Cyclobacterium plantarum]
MKKPGKIDVIQLIQELDSMLISLLEELSPADWEARTISRDWNVKDISVHLLDGNLRTLSMLRDGYYGEKPEKVNSHSDLVSFLNGLNADWVRAAKRLSPRVIIDLLRLSGNEYFNFLASLAPDDKAGFPVAWAGENESKNWFHIAREYTEKWHHQQQIRLAIGSEKELLNEKWYLPYLDTSLRALPHHYKSVAGEENDLIKFSFNGETEKSWYLYYDGSWELLESATQATSCEVSIPDELAWRIFTRGIRQDEALANSEIKGKRELGLKFFDMLAVMA